MPADDPFLEEVLGLFALEAQEWIQQSQSDLLELEQGPTSEQRAKLLERMICAITNLGGSAATLELSALEMLAFKILTLLESIRDEDRAPLAMQCAAIRAGLEVIALALQNLSETRKGTIPGGEEVLKRLADAVSVAGVAAANGVGKHSPSSPIAVALLDLQRREHGAAPERCAAEAIINRVQAQYGEETLVRLDRSLLGTILNELDTAEERLLNELQQKVPEILSILADLQSSALARGQPPVQVQAVLQHLQSLLEVAQLANMLALMQFLQGLHSFVTIACQRVLPIMPHTFEAVRSRLLAVLAEARQAIETGRAARVFIQKTLLC